MKKTVQMKCPHCGKQVDTSSIREEVQKEFLLKIKEKEKLINDLKTKLDDASKRIENYSHSQELAGESLEILVSENLSRLFVSDEFIDVKKGQNGADIIQIIKHDNISIAKLIIEIKNTSQFSAGWIDVLKKNSLAAGGDVMILCTKTLPKNFKGKFGVLDDVWICDYNYIEELILALRFGLIKLHTSVGIQSGRESKEQALFNYINSAEFNSLYGIIIEQIYSLRDLHNSEKVKTLVLWKSKEYMLNEILVNITEHAGTLKSITGCSIPELLETPLQVD